VAVLPEEALIHREDGDYVCLLRGREKEQYVFELVKIQKGTSSGGLTAVDNPEVFPEEARFLKRGAYALFGEE